MRTKLCLEVGYIGTRFVGWQPQPNCSGVSVFEELSRALSAAGLDGGPVAAGRTDKGVHAMRQVVTLTVRRNMPVDPHAPQRATELAELMDALNAHLPSDVWVLAAHDACPNAHAMSGSDGKTYSYFLAAPRYVADSPMGIASSWSAACWLLDRPLNVEAMSRAAASFVGEHDFRAFTPTQDPAKRTVRTILACSVIYRRDYTFPRLGCFAAGRVASPATCAVCASHGGAGTRAGTDVQAAARPVVQAELEARTEGGAVRVQSVDAPQRDGIAAPTHAPARLPVDSRGSDPAEARDPADPEDEVGLVHISFTGDGFLKHQASQPDEWSTC